MTKSKLGGELGSPESHALSITLQFEVENAALRETNKQQEAQIEELKKQMQGKNLYVFMSKLA